MKTRARAVAALASLTACAAPVPLPGAGPDFDAFRFFAGTTQGTGALSKLGGAPVPVRVQGIGRVEGNTLILRQTVAEGARPPRMREWRLRRTGPGRYAGTLSDAASPVEAVEQGPRLTIRYAARGGYAVTQVLDRVDADRADNRLTASVLGMPVTRLSETIARVSP